MIFQRYVIMLLCAILDTLMFPNLIDANRDCTSQFLMSNAIRWIDKEIADESIPRQ